MSEGEKVDAVVLEDVPVEVPEVDEKPIVVEAEQESEGKRESDDTSENGKVLEEAKPLQGAGDDPAPKTKVKVDEDYEVDEAEEEPPKFDIKPVLIIILCAVLGLATGIALADGRGSPELISWFALPGDLFVRALKCVVLPLVFVNIVLAVVDMVRAGKASSVGVKTILFYFFTTLVASIEGLISVLMFQGSFSQKENDDSATEPLVQILCPNPISGTGDQGILTMGVDGSLSCTAPETSDQVNFTVDNKNEFLTEVDGGGVQDDISFSDTLQDGIFRKMISDNITGDFIRANFVGVIVFAIVFAASSQSLKRQPQVLIELFEESNRIFLKIVDWIILLTPIAVFSLIAGNLGEEDDLSGAFKDIGILIACTLVAMTIHFIFYQLIFLLFVRKNPLPYLKFIFPAQVFAFASASSAATLPLSLKCVLGTGEVPKSIGNFVLSMGSTINMDGGAIYFPTAIVFLAVADGLEDELDAAAYFLIILLSTIGSAGAAPVPSASLVLIITAYNTVFDKTGTPEAFGLILGIDWLMDRFRTLLNVTGDTYMARIITAVSGMKPEDDVLENEAADN